METFLIAVVCYIIAMYPDNPYISIQTIPTLVSRQSLHQYPDNPYISIQKIPTLVSRQSLHQYPDNPYISIQTIPTLVSRKYLHQYPDNLYISIQTIPTLVSRQSLHQYPDNPYISIQTIPTLVSRKYLHYYPDNLYISIQTIPSLVSRQSLHQYPDNPYISIQTIPSLVSRQSLHQYPDNPYISIQTIPTLVSRQSLHQYPENTYISIQTISTLVSRQSLHQYPDNPYISIQKIPTLVSRQSLHQYPYNPYISIQTISTLVSRQSLHQYPDNPYISIQKIPTLLSRQSLHQYPDNPYISIQTIPTLVSRQSLHQYSDNPFISIQTIPSLVSRQSLHQYPYNPYISIQKIPTLLSRQSLHQYPDNPYISIQTIPTLVSRQSLHQYPENTYISIQTISTLVSRQSLHQYPDNPYISIQKIPTLVSRQSLHQYPDNPYISIQTISTLVSRQSLHQYPDNPYISIQKIPTLLSRQSLHQYPDNPYISIQTIPTLVSRQSLHQYSDNPFISIQTIPSLVSRQSLHQYPYNPYISIQKIPTLLSRQSLHQYPDNPFISIQTIPSLVSRQSLHQYPDNPYISIHTIHSLVSIQSLHQYPDNPYISIQTIPTLVSRQSLHQYPDNPYISIQTILTLVSRQSLHQYPDNPYISIQTIPTLVSRQSLHQYPYNPYISIQTIPTLVSRKSLHQYPDNPYFSISPSIQTIPTLVYLLQSRQSLHQDISFNPDNPYISISPSTLHYCYVSRQSLHQYISFNFTLLLCIQTIPSLVYLLQLYIIVMYPDNLFISIYPSTLHYCYVSRQSLHQYLSFNITLLLCIQTIPTLVYLLQLYIIVMYPDNPFISISPSTLHYFYVSRQSLHQYISFNFTLFLCIQTIPSLVYLLQHYIIVMYPDNPFISIYPSTLHYCYVSRQSLHQYISFNFTLLLCIQTIPSLVYLLQLYIIFMYPDNPFISISPSTLHYCHVSRQSLFLVYLLQLYIIVMYPDNPFISISPSTLHYFYVSRQSLHQYISFNFTLLLCIQTIPTLVSLLQLYIIVMYPDNPYISISPSTLHYCYVSRKSLHQYISFNFTLLLCIQTIPSLVYLLQLYIIVMYPDNPFISISPSTLHYFYVSRKSLHQYISFNFTLLLCIQTIPSLVYLLQLYIIVIYQDNPFISISPSTLHYFYVSRQSLHQYISFNFTLLLCIQTIPSLVYLLQLYIIFMYPDNPFISISPSTLHYCYVSRQSLHQYISFNFTLLLCIKTIPSLVYLLQLYIIAMYPDNPFISISPSTLHYCYVSRQSLHQYISFNFTLLLCIQTTLHQYLSFNFTLLLCIQTIPSLVYLLQLYIIVMYPDNPFISISPSTLHYCYVSRQSLHQYLSFNFTLLLCIQTIPTLVYILQLYIIVMYQDNPFINIYPSTLHYCYVSRQSLHQYISFNFTLLLCIQTIPSLVYLLQLYIIVMYPDNPFISISPSTLHYFYVSRQSLHQYISFNFTLLLCIKTIPSLVYLLQLYIIFMYPDNLFISISPSTLHYCYVSRQSLHQYISFNFTLLLCIQTIPSLVYLLQLYIIFMYPDNPFISISPSTLHYCYVSRQSLHQYISFNFTLFLCIKTIPSLVYLLQLYIIVMYPYNPFISISPSTLHYCYVSRQSLFLVYLLQLYIIIMYPDNPFISISPSTLHYCYVSRQSLHQYISFNFTLLLCIQTIPSLVSLLQHYIIVMYPDNPFISISPSTLHYCYVSRQFLH